MSKIYNREYYLHYEVGVGTEDYETSAYTRDFLRGLAVRIVEDLHPTAVLDAGCAMGHLVAALRELGVEAYGIDLSEYAISKVREDIRPYCAVASIAGTLPSEFPQRYDLIVSLEVLEHLYDEDGKEAIRKLCERTDQILFSSTPDGFNDPTHLNVRQREYWVRQFAEEGFFDDLNYRPSYLTSYAIFFRRSTDWLRQVEDYERVLRQEEAKRLRTMQDLQQTLAEQENRLREALEAAEAERGRSAEELEALRRRSAEELETLRRRNAEELEALRRRSLEELEAVRRQQSERLADERSRRAAQEAAREEERKKADAETSALRLQNEGLTRRLSEFQLAYQEISTAFFWRITKPFRLLLDCVKALPPVRLAGKGLRCLKENGVRYTWRKVRRKLRRRPSRPAPKKYTAQELEQLFPQRITFSILVPLYNTPPVFLKEMLHSVLDQSYGYWELCLADGSDSAHGEVEKLVRQYAGKEPRIRYRRLRQNLGISGNTNACLEMAAGEYIALFDHDDWLHPDALFEVMRAICEKRADFVYTDETTFSQKPEDAYCPHFKPDFSPDTLRSYNYICHFTVFRRALLQKTGGFRSEFDGSQDYDLILRLTEQAERIVHIPRILYYWRSHPDSAAQDVAAKPYALEAAKKALAEHLARVGLKGTVLDSKAPSTYRIRYELSSQPLVSILIPNKDNVSDLQKCVRSIREKTSYPHWEILILENNSTEPETFACYSELTQDPRIRVLYWPGSFNYSAINNFGRKSAAGDYLLLLNNDVEAISPDWLEEMLMFCQRSDVGAVGAMLFYPDQTIQHAGVIVGLGGVAGHSHKSFPADHVGYMYRLTIAQNLSAVTAACMMLRREVWDQVGGLDEGFAVAFNDVDLCMRIRQAGYLVVWTPYARLYHYESKSRGSEDTPEKQKRFQSEIRRFQERWAAQLAAGDPYYNPNLTLDREDFSEKP